MFSDLTVPNIVTRQSAPCRRLRFPSFSAGSRHRVACQPKWQTLHRSSYAKASEDNLLGFAAKIGGADRDRTDDLKLAKLALSQLSYGPVDC